MSPCPEISWRRHVESLMDRPDLTKKLKEKWELIAEVPI